MFYVGLLDEKTTSNMSNDDETESANKRRLTNHSARRFLLQKLDDCGFEHNHI